MLLRVCNAFWSDFIPNNANFLVNIVAWGYDSFEIYIIRIRFSTINFIWVFIVPINATKASDLTIFDSLKTGF